MNLPSCLCDTRYVLAWERWALRLECWHVARGNEMNWEMCCDTGKRTVGSERVDVFV